MLVQKPKVMSVKLSEIAMDKATQMRASINRNAILDYAEMEQQGSEPPPIVLFGRFGRPKYHVGDGWHRIFVKRRLGKKTILAEVRNGGRREAVLYAASANLKHGVRPSLDDRRKACITLLKDAEWRKWTDTTIARQCGLNQQTVAKYREWMKPEKEVTKEQVRTYVDREGRERTRTVPKSVEDPELGAMLRGEKCPYCGAAMKRG
jgi:uncharacterized ParB-like nuclease family protein